MELVLEAWLISSLIMILLWFFYLYKDEPCVVDIGWGGSIGIASFWIYCSAPNGGFRQSVILFCVLFWSIRLSSLLLSRLLKGQKDRRYIALSKYWGKGLWWKYFLFFQAQAFSVGLLTIPIILSCLVSDLNWTFFDSLGLLLFLFGISGEVLADHQMLEFRKNPDNRKKVCEVGLWYYSRHPNYFFEWMIWVSYAVIAMNHPYGVIGWISPLAILISILKVTGIPPTEARMIESKGEAYREYQRSTSAFIPMPKRRP